MSNTTGVQNHLLLGLGGTGGKILRAFRKSVFQEFRTNQPAIERLKLAYLYVDSSEEMMRFDDPTWKILGESVQLGTNSQLTIKGADLTTRLENIRGYPGIQHWIGSREQWRDILNNTVGDVLGGQKRRLGRFLFSCKSTEFRERVKGLVSEMENTGSRGATFHICCGLAGGTGSGGVVDAVSQIRDLYRDTKLYRIRLYCYLPETHPKAGWDAGNYHANGYAALVELNALSVGSWVPHDVTGLTSRSEAPTLSDKARFDARQLQAPFTGCYLYTNVNANGVQLDVETELPSVVSDFLYQKIITSRTVKLDEVDRMENVENRTDTTEIKEGSQEKIRSKAFLTFGIKRLAVPEEEIKEFLTFHFARQAALQMGFNNWSDDFGFTDVVRNVDFNSLVRQPEIQAKWKLSDEHLLQSIGILPEDANSKEWKTLTLEWKVLAAAFKELAREKDEALWLDTLEKLYEDRFAEKYRKMGVRRFYQIKLRSRRDIVRQIRETVEGELFAEWKNGVKSIVEIGQVVTALIDSTEERLQSVEGQVLRDREDETKGLRDVDANKKAWAKLGILSRAMLKKDERLLDAQSLCLERLYITRTYLEARDFAKQLLHELITELNDLQAEVGRSASTLSDGLRFFTDNANSRCGDVGEADLRKNVIRFYDPEKVHTLAKLFVKDGETQRTQTSAVRSRLAADLGEKQTFAHFNQRVGRDTFNDLCQLQCSENVEQAHEAFVLAARGRGRIFGVNIVEKLEERYRPGSEELRKFVKDLVEHSGALLPFNDSQINLSGVPGVPESRQPSHMFLIVRPKDPTRKTFVDALELEFKHFSQGTQVLFADSVGKMSEISLIRISNCFPLRFVEPLQFLRERYEHRVTSSNAERAKLEVHLEGDGTQHPSLFVVSLEETRRQGLPFLVLAKALGLIKTHENRTTGLRELVLLRKDADGTILAPIRLGATLSDAFESLDWSTADQIRQMVREVLLSKENAHVEKRRAMQDAINADLDQLLESVGGDFESPMFRQFQEATRKAVKILKGEA